MVDGANAKSKQQQQQQQSSANNKSSFNDQNQTKIVLRRLPPSLTSEQFLEAVSPLPDHDYYRFCKADLSLGQQYAFSRAYLNIPNRQELIIFTEKFQGYVFVDKNGNEYPCSVEYAPNQSRPKSEQNPRKDPKLNSIEQDPEYQTFVANMNAPISAAEALPNAEVMLEEIEKKQRDIQDSKNKSGVTSTPLLEYLKQIREERKQEKILRNQQRRIHKQASRNTASNMNEEEYSSSSRYPTGGRSQRGYEKSDYRPSKQEQKRSNEYGGNKSGKNRENPKPKQQQQQSSTKEPKPTTHPKTIREESSASASVEPPPKRETDKSSIDERPASSSSQKSSDTVPKARPSMQIYNPGERARLRKQQNPSS